MVTFVSDQFAKLLKQNQLDSFEKIWNYPLDWFEQPNERRGGWSGVGKVALHNENGEQLNVYIKKQQHHGRRTWLHPIKGEPTFRRECARLQFLAAHQFVAPNVAFYAEAKVDGKQCAVLMTVALDEYRDLSDLSLNWLQNANKIQQKNLINAIAIALKRFHQLGLVHRALYPKHVFVKNVDTQPEIALIDLEKARFGLWFWRRASFDLAALNRHTTHWRRTQRLAFLKAYLEQDTLTIAGKWLARSIVKRAKR